jgi:hypothetical protein
VGKRSGVGDDFFSRASLLWSAVRSKSKLQPHLQGVLDNVDRPGTASFGSCRGRVVADVGHTTVIEITTRLVALNVRRVGGWVLGRFLDLTHCCRCLQVDRMR